MKPTQQDFDILQVEPLFILSERVKLKKNAFRRKTKAIFLDKDGTLIPDLPYNIDLKKISINKDAIEGLQLFQSYGYLLVIVSNQAGLAHGFFSEEDMEAVKKHMVRLCSHLGIYIDGFYYCPHHPNGIVKSLSKSCDCRKPLPGLLHRAATELNIDLSRSWMIGDLLNDVEAGNRAGCRSILIDNGNENEWTAGEYRTAEYHASNLTGAAKYILTAVSQESNKKRLVREQKPTATLSVPIDAP